MKSYTYLLINFFSVIVPLASSFESKIAFFKQCKAWFLAILLTGILFTTWDIFFTRWEIWGFNEQYLIGINYIGLPIEEWLFFFTIPYACIFLYETLNYTFPNSNFIRHEALITNFLIAISLGFAIIYKNKLYTVFIGLLTACLLAWHQWYKHSPYLGRFYRAYFFLLLPFAIVNGLLTGSFFTDGIVWYNNQHNLGIRLGAIPIEDFFYALSLILLNITFYEIFKIKTSLPLAQKSI